MIDIPNIQYRTCFFDYCTLASNTVLNRNSLIKDTRKSKDLTHPFRLGQRMNSMIYSGTNH